MSHEPMASPHPTSCIGKQWASNSMPKVVPHNFLAWRGHRPHLTNPFAHLNMPTSTLARPWQRIPIGHCQPKHEGSGMSGGAAHGHCPSFLLQRMPNNKPKGSPSRSPKRAATPAHCQPTQLAHIAMHTTMPAHCLPTSSVMPSLFPANMRSNACVLQANTRSNALPISNQHAQHQ